MNTIHPNELFAPFSPDPDGQSWTLTTDAEGNLTDSPGTIWRIYSGDDHSYAIFRLSPEWRKPETLFRGRIWARWFFRLLMLNFESPPKIEWEQKSPKVQKKRRPGKNHKGHPVDTGAIVALLPPEGASRPQWVALGKAAGFGKTCVYKHIKKAKAARLVVVASGGLFSKSPEKP